MTLRLQGYSMLPSQNPCYTAGWIYYPTLRQYWYNAIILIQCNIDTMRPYWYVVSTVCGRCEFDIAISILQQRCQDYIHSTMWVKLTTWRWGNVGATCRFDIVASTKPQQCALATQRCDVTATLSQRCVFAGWPFFLQRYGDLASLLAFSEHLWSTAYDEFSSLV